MSHRVATLAAFIVMAGACTQPSTQRHAPTPVASTPVALPPAASTQIATNPAPEVSQQDAPPTENGVYSAHGLCFGEGGCPWRHWRASGANELHARVDMTAPVIATVAAGDWVEAMEGVYRMVPLRGVVRKAEQGLQAGDVVYLLEPQGEGVSTLWRRGERLDWQDPGETSEEEQPGIQWNQTAPDGPTLGWWVRVKLASGMTGWVRNPQFECMGPLAGDDNCRG